MTAYIKIAAGKQRTSFNKKDGPGRRSKQLDTLDGLQPLVKEGAVRTGINRVEYKIGFIEGCPTFTISSQHGGIEHGFQAGFMARCDDLDEPLFFPRSTPIGEIMATLDDCILGILGHYAELADSIEYDFDEFMFEVLEADNEW